MIRAVLWDFGGVILSSPFEAFNRYEAANGLPLDFIRGVNATNPDTNAWARLERSDVSPTEFDALFADESEALGYRVPGADVLGLLSGQIRPEMVTALDRVIRAGYRTACLTNNVVGGEQRMDVGPVGLPRHDPRGPGRYQLRVDGRLADLHIRGTAREAKCRDGRRNERTEAHAEPRGLRNTEEPGEPGPRLLPALGRGRVGSL